MTSNADPGLSSGWDGRRQWAMPSLGGGWHIVTAMVTLTLTATLTVTLTLTLASILYPNVL